MKFTAPAGILMPPIVSGCHASGTSPNDMGKIRASADTVLKMQLPRDTGLVSDASTVRVEAHTRTRTRTHAGKTVRLNFLKDN